MLGVYGSDGTDALKLLNNSDNNVLISAARVNRPAARKLVIALKIFFLENLTNFAPVFCSNFPCLRFEFEIQIFLINYRLHEQRPFGPSKYLEEKLSATLGGKFLAGKLSVVTSMQWQMEPEMKVRDRTNAARRKYLIHLVHFENYIEASSQGRAKFHRLSGTSSTTKVDSLSTGSFPPRSPSCRFNWLLVELLWKGMFMITRDGEGVKVFTRSEANVLGHWPKVTDAWK